MSRNVLFVFVSTLLSSCVEVSCLYKPKLQTSFSLCGNEHNTWTDMIRNEFIIKPKLNRKKVNNSFCMTLREMML